MAQEEIEDGARLTSGDVLRVIAATLGVAVVAAGALLVLFGVLLGQALGGVIESLMGRGAAVMSDGRALGWVLLVFAGQLGMSWLAASRLVPPARRRGARQLALGLSLLLGLLPVLGFGVMSRSMQARHQELNQQLEQRLEQERQRRRAEDEARSAELQRNLELEKQRLEERARNDEAEVLALKQKILDDLKRKGARKKK